MKISNFLVSLEAINKIKYLRWYLFNCFSILGRVSLDTGSNSREKSYAERYQKKNSMYVVLIKTSFWEIRHVSTNLEPEN